MKQIYRYGMRRALAALVAGVALGGLIGSTSGQSIYRMQLNYPPGTAAPYNAGGGIPAQSILTLTNQTSTNCTLGWYGMMGWYTIQGSTDAVNWSALASIESADFSWSGTVTNPPGPSGFFRLFQTNSYAGQGNCGGCHGDKYTPWTQTAHASALSVLQSIGQGNNASCLPCHTVGFNQPTGYTNGYTALANVGCENCHGPAGWHKNSDHSVILPAVSLDPAICGSCHQGSVHPTYEEYTTTNSWGLYVGLSHSHTSQSSSTGCAFCHQANNRMVMLNEYNDQLAGRPHPLTLWTGTNATAWTATCATCHDPHSSNQVAQLRYPTHSTNFFTMPTTFDTELVVTTNFNGTTTTNSVALNTVFNTLYNPNVQVCGQCHNSRGNRWDGNAYAVVTNQVPNGNVTNAVATVAVITPLIPYTNLDTSIGYATNSSGYGRAPHPTPQYNVLIGNVDYDYATVAGVPNKTHAHSGAPDQCVTCHVPNYAVNAHTNVTGHSFGLDYYGCLTSCHSTYTPDALTAKINNLQFIESNNIVRDASLLTQWALNETAGTLLTNYGQLAWEYTSPGALGTTSAKYKAGPPSAYSAKLGAVPAGTNDDLQLLIPQDIRIARNDIYMAYNDQSLGVHNPTYVQALLDDAAARVTKQFTYANFSASTVSGFAPLTVKFTAVGSNTNNITGYNWNFGDGNTAASANPTDIYTNPGIYTVTFTATNATGSETLMKTNYIRVLTQPTVSFVADQTTVTAGTTVNFTSTSANTANIFRWGWYPQLGVSGAPNYALPGSSTTFSYTYTNAGNYTVQLVAYCPGGANGSYNRIYVTNVNYIHVVGANFVASSTNGSAPMTVTFTNKSGGAASYLWSFGDGDTSTSTTPVNVYTNTGSYTVSLSAINGVVTNTLTLANYIVVNPAPIAVASFTATPAAGPAPLTVNFTNTSTNATGYLWTFNLNSSNAVTSTAVNPVFTFTNAAPTGYPVVTLLATNAYNGSTATNSSISVLAALTNNAMFVTAPGGTNFSTGVPITFIPLGAGITNFYWTFGDGGWSTSPSPTHTYSASGPMVVSFTANSYTNCKSTIYIYPAPVASFTAGPVTGTHPLTVNFTNTSVNATSYLWTFNLNSSNAVTATTTSPVFTFTNAAPAGYPVVTLQASSLVGSTTATNASIHVN